MKYDEHGSSSRLGRQHSYSANSKRLKHGVEKASQHGQIFQSKNYLTCSLLLRAKLQRKKSVLTSSPEMRVYRSAGVETT